MAVMSRSHVFFKEQLLASAARSSPTQHELPGTLLGLYVREDGGRGGGGGCRPPLPTEAGSLRHFLPRVTELTFLCEPVDPGVKVKVRPEGADWGAWVCACV